ncbi:MAG: hypothetical protein PF569_01880 [Candidatus Woesearchaeota archaeon]|jgi:hypothetical protein|nr:hypothetical protein [Candidatus Woesearchaeota archaeon]
MADIIITTNLPGQVEGPVKHSKKQSNKVYYSSGSPEVRKIIHTDRNFTSCQRILHIAESVVKSWVKGDCPNWVRPSNWKHMTTKQRLVAHVNSFDEGFGVSYQEISN